LLNRWLEQGVRHFVFTLHHQAEHISAFVEREVANGSLRGCQCTIVVEERPLGTGGAVLNAMKVAHLDTDVLVGNADTWLDTGIADLAAAPSPAMIVVENPDVARFGSVILRDGLVTGFAEKSANSSAGWINGGFYKLNIDAFPDSLAGRAFSIEQDVFPGLAGAGRLRAVPVEGSFIDIGVPDDYAGFCERNLTQSAGER
jgi:D-glycero-alpha-D-manno-heptose 1-phosphate guanylyltransferase